MRCLFNLLAHYPCYRHTISSTKTLFGKCASSSDHVVIYGIILDYDNEVKILSRTEPVSWIFILNFHSNFQLYCVESPARTKRQNIFSRKYVSAISVILHTFQWKSSVISVCPVYNQLDRVPPSLGGMEITCHISIVPTRPFWFSSTFIKKYTMSCPQSWLLCSPNPLPEIPSS